MTEELQTLRDIVTRLETAGIDYMLTGSGFELLCTAAHDTRY